MLSLTVSSTTSLYGPTEEHAATLYVYLTDARMSGMTDRDSLTVKRLIKIMNIAK